MLVKLGQSTCATVLHFHIYGKQPAGMLNYYVCGPSFHRERKKLIGATFPFVPLPFFLSCFFFFVLFFPSSPVNANEGNIRIARL